MLICALCASLPSSQAVAAEVSFSGGQTLQRVRLQVNIIQSLGSDLYFIIQDELDSGGHSGGLLDNDLIEYYQLLADKGDVQAQVLELLFLLQHFLTFMFNPRWVLVSFTTRAAGVLQWTSTTRSTISNKPLMLAMLSPWPSLAKCTLRVGKQFPKTMRLP